MFNNTETSPLLSQQDSHDIEFPRTPLVIILSVLSFGTVLGNSIVCFAINNHPALRHVTYLSIFSLAIADLMAGLIAIPSYIFKKFTWEEPYDTIVCDTFRASYFLTGYASILSLSIISVERLIAIKIPLKHMTIVTRRRVIVALLFVWSEALIISSLPFVPWDSNDSYKQCNYQPPHWWSIMVIISNVIVPFLVIVACYTFMYLTAQTHIKKICSDKKGVKYNTVHFSACRERNERRGNITIMIVIGVFVLSWFPSCFYYFLQKTCPQCFSESFESKESIVNALVKILTFTSSFLNPMIYCWRSREFRSVFLKICMKEKQKLTESFSSYINNHNTRRGNTELKSIGYSTPDLKRKGDIQENCNIKKTHVCCYV